ncbi:flagellar basal body rod protein [Buchnera aphidicola (Nipponaphis monzeni)]|uniref:Flagellar basal body rod protein FlgB n=1 Tax=Buchnera aphidicola (Nipponaphis monzeni) TaxID=2495405 RepID=A0A455TAA8_9GAMM|nr:flagellar basal body rod protein FlgB [Buchnera aphidicola]BBI01268.1 flagellar basal body rod protein [Buchnera aphidicola (Nipponaphis monzeni)]
MLTEINNLFQFNKKILKLISYQEELIASNIVNADTPNYFSKKINFATEVKKILNKDNISLSKTSRNHIPLVSNNTKYHVYDNVNLEKSAIKNSVNMNFERINFLNNSLKYQAEITFLNHQIKDILVILQS